MNRITKIIHSFHRNRMTPIKIIPLFLITFCIFLIPNTFAQIVDIPAYSFINEKSDTLVFYGTSKQIFDSFRTSFRKMVVFGDRSINILHLGDSHLQADISTCQTRKDFQTFLPGIEGSFGMVTPFTEGAPQTYKINFSKSFSSENIVHSADKAHLGLWGTTAVTSSRENTITIDINKKNAQSTDFNVLRIYHSPLDEGDEIVLDVQKAYQKIEHEKEGYTEFFLADYLNTITINITKSSSSRLYIYGFYFSSNNAGVTYNVSGTNGATALSYLNAEMFSQHLETLPMDLIIISLGTNDTYEQGGENTFKGNLVALVNKIREVKPLIPIILTSPVECWHHGRRINPRQEETVKIIEEVCKQHSLIYLDMYTVLGGKNSVESLRRSKLMQKDKIHLTAKGYELQGNLVYNALWRSLID